jgi:hypothetical protein
MQARGTNDAIGSLLVRPSITPRRVTCLDLASGMSDPSSCAAICEEIVYFLNRLRVLPCLCEQIAPHFSAFIENKCLASFRVSYAASPSV